MDDDKVKRIVNFVNNPIKVSLEELVWDSYVEELDFTSLNEGYLFNYNYTKVTSYDEVKNRFVVLIEIFNIAYVVVDKKDLGKHWVKYDLKNHKAYFVDRVDESDNFYLPVRRLSNFSNDQVVGFIRKNLKKKE